MIFATISERTAVVFHVLAIGANKQWRRMMLVTGQSLVSLKSMFSRISVGMTKNVEEEDSTVVL